MMICRYFQQGRCAKGDTCTFEHTTKANSIPAPSVVTVGTPTRSHNLEKQIPCAFFQRGYCWFGVTCKNAHETSTTPVPPPSAPIDTRSGTICAFFLRNACSKGTSCPFSHAAPVHSSTNLTKSWRTNESTKLQQGQDIHSIKEHSSTLTGFVEDASSRSIGAATVTFANGAAVSKILLPSDYSTLALTNIPVDESSRDLGERLRTWANCDTVSIVSITLDPQTSKKSAQVKIADGGRASRTAAASGHSFKLTNTNIEVRAVQLGESVSGTNRLQLSGVTCSWYDPSKTAHLRYGSAKFATRALLNLSNDSRELRGRRPTFELAQDSKWINVGNLDVQTTVTDLTLHFHRFPTPLEIGIGRKSHGMSSEVIKGRIKRSFEKHGQLLEWSVTQPNGSAQIKAYAKFQAEQEALQAMKQLDGSKIDSQSNDTLHVQHVVSVKLPVSQRVLSFIKSQLDALSQTARSAHHVSIKVYDNQLKAYTQVRVSGPDKTTVARVKLQIEELLAGNIATDGTQPLANSFFFQTSSSAFFDHTMHLCGVLIVRDRRRMVLRIYGDHPLHVRAALETLQEKAKNLESEVKEYILNQTTLTAAVTGGFQRMSIALGKDKVNFDITSNPKRIRVTGSENDVALVDEILRSRQFDLAENVAGLSIIGNEAALCVVCWTPAEDPVVTKCGHVYCSSCIEFQATSEPEFPLCCLGDSGKCDTPLTLEELKQILPVCSYKALLEASLTKHIRTHPENFQYCSTPDCDRFYRISPSDAAIVFNCDRCLASICTACHNAAHDGQTCDEIRAGRDGADEFTAWKKDNDARDCPNCGTTMQKSVGCNHMMCSACRTHICWHCMKTFKTGPEVYGHMTKDHGGDWGLGWVPADFE